MDYFIKSVTCNVLYEDDSRNRIWKCFCGFCDNKFLIKITGVVEVEKFLGDENSNYVCCKYLDS